MVRRGTGAAAVSRRPPNGLGDGIRLAVGTLTVLPVPAPTRVDRDVAGWAMMLAPAAGAVPAVVAGGLLGLLVAARAPALLAAALAIGLLAALTRGMHLDGLADVADGLGCGRPVPEALEVMRRGDIGPFGVVTLVVVLLMQVTALGALVEQGPGSVGPAGLAVALVVSRLVLPVLCSRGVPAARTDGLGSMVAGSVDRPRLAGACVMTAGLLVVPVLGVGLWAGLAAALVGVLAAGVLAHRAVRRFGGITGDVLGAAVEVAFTTVLVVLALLGRS